MKNIFNHLFYRIYYWNTKVIKEPQELSLLTALLGIVVVHGLSVSVIIFTILIVVIKNTQGYPKWLHMMFMGIILIIDYLNYVHNGYYKEVFANEQSLERSKLKIKDIQITAYIAVIILVLIFPDLSKLVWREF
jgi:hypothetical protein